MQDCRKLMVKVLKMFDLYKSITTSNFKQFGIEGVAK